MKRASLFLLLCGIARSVASSSCTWEEFAKCEQNKSMPSESMETEAELEEYCSVFFNKVECEIKVMERCPILDVFNSLETIKETRRYFRLICDKENPLRQKFLDNVQCLHQYIEDMMGYCNDGEKVDFTDEKADLAKNCRKLRKVFKCAEEKVVEICNEDTKEVFVEFMNPVYHLRQVKCE